jgi:hypothetical protein
MAKKTNKRSGSAAGLARVTRQKLIDGLPGPGGLRIRYARPEEAAVVTALLKEASADLETGHLEALAEGRCGTWLLTALRGPAWSNPTRRCWRPSLWAAAGQGLLADPRTDR